MSEELEPGSTAARLAGRYPFVYLLLMLVSGLVLADAYMPPEHFMSTVEEARQVELNNSTKHSRIFSYWSVVTLANGGSFQVESMADVYPVGDTLEVERTALLGEVLRYRNIHSAYTGWNEIALRDREYDAFPALVLCCCFLLLLPVRAEQYRWTLHGALMLLLFSWLVTMLGTGGLKWLV
jgi:hypothetical protein